MMNPASMQYHIGDRYNGGRGWIRGGFIAAPGMPIALTVKTTVGHWWGCSLQWWLGTDVLIAFRPRWIMGRFAATHQRAVSLYWAVSFTACLWLPRSNDETLGRLFCRWRRIRHACRCINPYFRCREIADLVPFLY